MNYDEDKPEGFSTRTEAERAIAERGQVLEKKAQRRGGPWLIVDNDTGDITRSQFVEAYKQMCRENGRNMGDIVKITKEALEHWTQLAQIKRKGSTG